MGKSQEAKRPARKKGHVGGASSKHEEPRYKYFTEKNRCSRSTRFSRLAFPVFLLERALEKGAQKETKERRLYRWQRGRHPLSFSKKAHRLTGTFYPHPLVREKKKDTRAQRNFLKKKDEARTRHCASRKAQRRENRVICKKKKASSRRYGPCLWNAAFEFSGLKRIL